jgi:hypothetical protein
MIIGNARLEESIAVDEDNESSDPEADLKELSSEDREWMALVSVDATNKAVVHVGHGTVPMTSAFAYHEDEQDRYGYGGYNARARRKAEGLGAPF